MLQGYLRWDANVMNRIGFQKVARSLGCQLYLPFPGESVALLRTGLLRHIDSYMQVHYPGQCRKGSTRVTAPHSCSGEGVFGCQSGLLCTPQVAQHDEAVSKATACHYTTTQAQRDLWPSPQC